MLGNMAQGLRQKGVKRKLDDKDKEEQANIKQKPDKEPKPISQVKSRGSSSAIVTEAPQQVAPNLDSHRFQRPATSAAPTPYGDFEFPSLKRLGPATAGSSNSWEEGRKDQHAMLYASREYIQSQSHHGTSRELSMAAVHHSHERPHLHRQRSGAGTLAARRETFKTMGKAGNLPPAQRPPSHEPLTFMPPGLRPIHIGSRPAPVPPHDQAAGVVHACGGSQRLPGLADLLKGISQQRASS